MFSSIENVPFFYDTVLFTIYFYFQLLFKKMK